MTISQSDKPYDLIRPHVRDIGGLNVRRLLPSHPHKMVGPFIFFDHMGPAAFGPGAGLDVRPHPHIGLATVTYLFEGTILHRDSLGNVQPIRPGDVNWMTAGSGIAHSERTPAELRESGGTLHGIQVWVALPKAHEGVAPSFEHHPAATLPSITSPGVSMRVIAGSAFGETAPTTTFSDMFYVTATMAAGTHVRMPAEFLERAVYPVDGEVFVGGNLLAAQHMAVLPGAQEITIEAKTNVHVMLLGGQPLDGDRFIWWNFVASSREAIRQAKERWRVQQFGSVPDESEWIPLPDEPKAPESFS
ncbi:pirin family protein [Noviherbaspirillum agri]